MYAHRPCRAVRAMMITVTACSRQQPSSSTRPPPTAALNILTSAKEGAYYTAFVCLSVCLFVCLSVSRITQEVVDEFWWNISQRCNVSLARTDDKTVEYHLDPMGSSQVCMLYIVGNVSPNAIEYIPFDTIALSRTEKKNWRFCAITAVSEKK